MFPFKRWLVITSIVLMAFLSIQTTRAGDCADGNNDACWARWYAGGGSPGNESRVYFRIFKACRDGMQVGIAANIVDSYDIYVKQYGPDLNPAFRLLTDVTTIPLDPVPGGVDIEYTNESASGYAGVHTIYFMKIFNIGWSEAFDPDYILMVLAAGFNYSEDDSTGLVRSADLENCRLFGHPFLTAKLAPFVQCVIDERGNVLTARFGYFNNTGYDTFIPKGAYNRIFGAFSKFGATNPPTVLETGVHNNAVTASQPAFALTWKLGTFSDTASLLSPRCRGV